MEGRKYQLEIRGEKKSYPAATTYMAIAKEYQQFYEDDIVLVLVNNRLRELKRTLDTDGVMEFVTTADKAGKKAYRRSVSLLMQKAVHNLYGEDGVTVRILHSIGQGNYCELCGGLEMTQEVISELKKEMIRLCDADLPIAKRNIDTEEAVELFNRLGMKDKERRFGGMRAGKRAVLGFVASDK